MRLSIIRVNWRSVGQRMIAAGTRSCVIALHSCPRGFALSLCLWLAELTSLFRRFNPLLLVQDCSGVIAPCSFHFIAVSSAVMPPRRARNSLESSVPPAVSSAPPSTVSVSTNAVLHPCKRLVLLLVLPYRQNF